MEDLYNNEPAWCDSHAGFYAENIVVIIYSGGLYMSIFKINSDLYNQILNEADDEEAEDFNIDDDQFNDDGSDEDTSSDDGGDAKSQAADEIMSDDNGEDTGESSDAAEQAANEIMSDDGDSGEATEDSTDSGETEADTTGEDTGSDDGEGDSGGDDFNIDMGDEEGGGESGDGESMDGDTTDGEGGEDSGDDTSGGDSSGEVTDELIEKEKELFSDLTEKQITIRTNELKGLYIKMMDTIGSTAGRLSSAPNTKTNTKIIKYLVNKLNGLQKMVEDYMIDTFETKTYIENTIYYHKCLMQLNLIKDILKEMSLKTQKQDKQE